MAECPNSKEGKCCYCGKAKLSSESSKWYWAPGKKYAHGECEQCAQTEFRGKELERICGH